MLLRWLWQRLSHGGSSPGNENMGAMVWNDPLPCVISSCLCKNVGQHIEAWPRTLSSLHTNTHIHRYMHIYLCIIPYFSQITWDIIAHGTNIWYQNRTQGHSYLWAGFTTLTAGSCRLLIRNPLQHCLQKHFLVYYSRLTSSLAGWEMWHWALAFIDILTVLKEKSPVISAGFDTKYLGPSPA